MTDLPSSSKYIAKADLLPSGTYAILDSKGKLVSKFQGSDIEIRDAMSNYSLTIIGNGKYHELINSYYGDSDEKNLAAFLVEV